MYARYGSNMYNVLHYPISSALLAFIAKLATSYFVWCAVGPSHAASVYDYAHPGGGGGGGTQIWFWRGCAAEAAKPVPIFKP